MIHKSCTNKEAEPFYTEYKNQGIPLNPIPQKVSQEEIDHASSKHITIQTVPLCMIYPSQTHISISNRKENGETVKLSKSMRFFADGGSWNKVFNVVSMEKESKEKEKGEALVTPHNRSLFSLSAV